MIGLVVATVLVTTLVTVPLTYVVARRPRQAMPARKLALFQEAMALIHRLRHPTDLDRYDVLSDQSKEAADRLLTQYQKEINR